MKHIKLSLSLLFILILNFGNVRASHIPSSNLTWTCDPSNPLCYTFIFTQVINCPSTNPSSMSSSQFTFSNNCGLANPTMGTMIQATSSYDVAQTCATATSTCAGGTVPTVIVGLLITIYAVGMRMQILLADQETICMFKVL